MEWTLDKGRPIVPQLCEQVCLRIALGKFLPEERLPSVREIALLAGVNPNTVQKALQLLEDDGLIVTDRTNGKFVAENFDVIKKQKEIIINKRFKIIQSIGIE